MTTPLQPMLDWYQSLSPQTLHRIDAFYTPDARFKDPFNEVQGTAAIAQIFRHMFEVTQVPRFIVDECVQQQQVAYVRWVFHFQLRGKAYAIQGMTRFELAEDGRVQNHRDYWDSGEELFQKLPWIGPLVAGLRARFRSS